MRATVRTRLRRSGRYRLPVRGRSYAVPPREGWPEITTAVRGTKSDYLEPDERRRLEAEYFDEAVLLGIPPWEWSEHVRAMMESEELFAAPPDKREAVMARQGFLDSWLEAKREMEAEETRRQTEEVGRQKAE